MRRLRSFVSHATVADLMRSPVASVSAQTALEGVARVLADERPPLLVVTNDEDALVGVITGADLEGVEVPPPGADPSPSELIAEGLHIESALTAAEVMSPYVYAARPSWPAARARAALRAHGLFAMPVVMEREPVVVGVVTLDDLRHVPEGAWAGRREAPLGIFRVPDAPPVGRGASLRSRVTWLAQSAASWWTASPVPPEHPSATTFAGRVLPILSDLYDDLAERYCRVQEDPELSELGEGGAAELDRLILWQADALATLSHLMQRLRLERRPERDLLEAVERLCHALLDNEARARALRRRARARRRPRPRVDGLTGALPPQLGPAAHPGAPRVVPR